MIYDKSLESMLRAFIILRVEPILEDGSNSNILVLFKVFSAAYRDDKFSYECPYYRDYLSGIFVNVILCPMQTLFSKIGNLFWKVKMTDDSIVGDLVWKQVVADIF